MYDGEIVAINILEVAKTGKAVIDCTIMKTTTWMIRTCMIVALVLVGSITLVLAQPNGVAVEWQMGFQEAATPVMERTEAFHRFLFYIAAGISIFVLILLLICVFRFNKRANPTPSKTSHNTPLEVVWTIIPVLILLVIAVPSFHLLFYQETIPEIDITIKATGHQWYWEYEYPDDDGLTFSSIMLEENELGSEQYRLLSVDNPLVVPVNTTIRVQITSADVLHSWAIPAFGVKMDAVPGRLNETWFNATEIGTYYGQCSELCGARHAFMPIEIRVVERNQYDNWLNEAKEEFAEAPSSPVASSASVTLAARAGGY
ncbi:MAG: cytochrome c oxidase subunit II [Parvularculales bacterium]